MCHVLVCDLHMFYEFALSQSSDPFIQSVCTHLKVSHQELSWLVCLQDNTSKELHHLCHSKIMPLIQLPIPCLLTALLGVTRVR